MTCDVVFLLFLKNRCVKLVIVVKLWYNEQNRHSIEGWRVFVHFYGRRRHDAWQTRKQR